MVPQKKPQLSSEEYLSYERASAGASRNHNQMNPVVIIEVLSDSTEAYRRGLKFFHYQFTDSLKEYILISQKLCRVEKFERQNNTWLYSEIHSIDNILEIRSINCTLPMADIYRKVGLYNTLQ